MPQIPKLFDSKLLKKTLKRGEMNERMNGLLNVRFYHPIIMYIPSLICGLQSNHSVLQDR